VPDRRADVLRSTEIVIEYADIKALKAFTDWDSAYVSDRDTSSSNPSSDTWSGSSSDSDKPGITVSENHIKSRAVKHPGDIPMIRDTVRGFTAVIFQHETDHLDGVLYIDRI
jgi:peptide deformylase